MRQTYSYELSLFGIVLRITASSLATARRKLLKRYLSAVAYHQQSWPLAPPVLLLSSDDPRQPVRDARLAPIPIQPRPTPAEPHQLSSSKAPKISPETLK